MPVATPHFPKSLFALHVDYLAIGGSQAALGREILGKTFDAAAASGAPTCIFGKVRADQLLARTSMAKADASEGSMYFGERIYSA